MQTLTEVKDRVVAFAAARDWDQFHNPKNLVMALSGEAGELGALFRWIDSAKSDDIAREEPTHTRMTEEIGDVGILLLLLCDRTGVNFLDAICHKLELNGRKYPVEQSKGRPDLPSNLGTGN